MKTRERYRLLAAVGVLALVLLPFPSSSDVVTSGDSTPIDTAGDFEIGEVIVGHSGIGSLTIGGGSTLRSYLLTTARVSAGAQGDVLVSGPGSRFVQTDPPSTGLLGNFEIGNVGTGSLTIDGGASVDLRSELGENCIPSNCNIFFGNASGSTAQLLISGPGSSLLAGRTSSGAGRFVLAHAGAGFGTEESVAEAVVEDAALLDTLNFAIGLIDPAEDGEDWEDGEATATLVVDDAQWLVTARPSALVFGGVGNGPGASGEVTVRNEGLLMVEPNTRVSFGIGESGGQRGTGTLRLESESAATFQSVFFGESGGRGDLLIDETSSLECSGADSDGQFAAHVAVGVFGGRGMATIEGEMSIAASAGQLFPGLYAGYGQGSDGVVEFVNSGQLAIAGDGQIVVGTEGGTGRLAFLDGATGEVVGPVATGIIVGEGSGGDGTLEVRGGADLTVDGAVQVAKDGAAGRVIVADGGVIHSDVVHLGDGGPGLELGQGASARVSVEDGGEIDALLVFVHDHGRLEGDGTIDGNVFVEGGIVAPGASARTLQIDGAFELTRGALELQIDGDAPGESDLLSVTSTATLDGGAVRVVVDESVPLPVSVPVVSAASGVLYDPAAVALLVTRGGVPISAELEVEGFTSLQLTVVPEPAAGWTAAAGAGCLALLARRRGRSEGRG